MRMTKVTSVEELQAELDRLKQELVAARSQIDSLHSATSELRASEERHRLLADTMLHGVVHQDSSGCIISMNPAAERILGKSREEFLGSNSTREDRDTIREDGSRFLGEEHPTMVALRTGEAVRNVIMGVWNPTEQRYRWIRIDAVPVLQADQTEPKEVYAVFEDITEQRSTEARLRTSEARLAIGMQVAGLALAEIDYDADTVRLSQGAASLYGLDEDSLTIRRAQLHATFHPDDVEELNKRIADSLSPDGPGMFEMDHRVVLPGGKVRWLHVRKHVTFDGDGPLRKPTRALLAAFDVTQEKQATEQVHASSKFVRSVLDSLPEHVVVLDEKGVVTTVNEPWENFARSNEGDPSKISIGVNYLDVCRKSAANGDLYAARALKGLEQVLDGTREQFVYEYPCHAPGRHQWFLMHALRMRHGASGAILSHIDITDRKRAEHELAEIHQRLSESHALLDTLSTQAPIGMGFVDEEFRYVRVNENLAAIHGIAPEDHLGRSVEQIVPDLWAKFELFYRQALAGMPVVNVEISGSIHRDDECSTPRHWLTSYYPVITDNRAIGVGIVVVEVTEQKRNEQALRDADRHKDEFLATLAHELRNPLAPIRASVEVLKLRALNDPELELSRDVIERQVKHMARLLEDLLDVSRISRNTLELRLERLELNDVLKLAIETSRPVIVAQEHRLTTQLPLTPVMLEADAVRLAQVFSNLLNNAAKYTERGGHIELIAELDGDEVVVRVKDNGIGIPPEMQPRIFDIFTQVNPAQKRSQGGLGIGLSLVKGLVELHGASISVYSQGTDRGSEFTVRLPVARAIQIPRPHIQPGTTAKQSVAGCRILIADDMRDNADTLGLILKMLGHEVCVAYGGEEACVKAGTFLPQLALLDIGMPKFNGYEVARFIRQQPWGDNIMLVALTGWAREEDRQRTLAAGFDYHLVKPVASATLIELIEKAQETQRA